MYDHTGVMGFTYQGQTYFYQKDLQGNIVTIVNAAGAPVVQYYYDAWGNHKVYDGDYITEMTSPTFIGNLNPFRYRGYYYDVETKLYYLQSRYYDPEVGRIISADQVEYTTPEAFDGLNIYAYCNNNPVMFVDPSGTIGVRKVLATLGILAASIIFAVAVVASAGSVAAVAGVAAAAVGLSASAVSTVCTVAMVTTQVLGVTIGLCGISDAIESFTGGYNPIRDELLGGDNALYNKSKTIYHFAGSVAITIGSFAPDIIKSVARYGTPKYYNGGVAYQLNFYDRHSNWSLRIDATTHGNPEHHYNPHIHTLFRDAKQGGFSDNVISIWELFYKLITKNKK